MTSPGLSIPAQVHFQGHRTPFVVLSEPEHAHGHLVHDCHGPSLLRRPANRSPASPTRRVSATLPRPSRAMVPPPRSQATTWEGTPVRATGATFSHSPRERAEMSGSLPARSAPHGPGRILSSRSARRTRRRSVSVEPPIFDDPETMAVHGDSGSPGWSIASRTAQPRNSGESFSRPSRKRATPPDGP